MRGWMLLVVPPVVIACSSAEPDDEGDGAGGLVNGGGGTGAWTTTTSTSSSTTTSSSSSSTSSTSGQGGACPDLGLGEANQTEDTAFKLKAEAISDNDGDGDTISGTIAGGADIDWFYYEGNDKPIYVVNPTRGLSSDFSGLRLCVFFQCLNGDTLFTCPQSTTPATSPHNREGCCGTAGFEVEDLDCTGTWDEHAYVYIRVDDPNGATDTCADYVVSYHY
ncbi:MAG: hypothetical protein JRI68_05315 [Deltaproteobacteria bacterium]|nr:hypothetical protein [Deltaproteobacteria bacterium]